MALSRQLLDLVDQRVAKALESRQPSPDMGTAAGTVVERTGATTALVTFLGSALPTPVKVFGDVNIEQGDRVGLVRLGVDWTIVGTFTRRRFLRVPDDAEPDEPQIFIGEPTPPELAAFYTAVTEVPIAFQVSRIDAINYTWDGLVAAFGNAPTRVQGACTAGNLQETMRVNHYFGNDPSYQLGAYSPTNWQINGAVAIGGTVVSGEKLAIDGVSQGRGLVGAATSVATIGGIGAEAIALSITGKTFRKGRAYRARLLGAAFNGSVANIAHLRVRKTNLAGAEIVGEYITPVLPVGGTGANYQYDWIFVNSTAADVAVTVVLTVQSSAGTVTLTPLGGAGVIAFQCWDCGAAAQFPAYGSV